MRRTVRVGSAFLLVLAFGLLAAAQPPRTAQGRSGDPQYGRADQRYDRRSLISPLSADLVRQAEDLSQAGYEYFMGWNGTINEAEQAILFRTEEFAACCRLFNRLVQDQTGYYRREMLRTNLYSAFRYVESAFRQLESQMRTGGMANDFGRMRRDGRRYESRLSQRPGSPLGLTECRRILSRIAAEFNSWR
jgi:PAS domain-containing protein